MCEVHDTIVNDQITSDDISLMKYKLWKTSLGFYAAIDITQKGECSRTVWHAMLGCCMHNNSYGRSNFFISNFQLIKLEIEVNAELHS